MAKLDIIKMLYRKQVPIDEFKFDKLMVYPLTYYLHPSAIMELHKIAENIKLQANPKRKYKMIDDILKPFGFKLLASGTNRVVYKHLEDQRIVIKVAIDSVGMRDNPNEFRNQQLLKPFVTKCFEISPCGTVGLFERVQPITSKYEFQSIAEDVFLLLSKLIGKYILDDVGSNFFLNYGLREGFGPVLLDFSYMYELDGNKLLCNAIDYKTGNYCLGDIDYDDGFNRLICTKCGKEYLATELQKQMDENNLVIMSDPSKKGVSMMKVALVKTTVDNGTIVKEEVIGSQDVDLIETSTIVSKKQFKDVGMKVSVKSVSRPIPYNKRKSRVDMNYEIKEPEVEAVVRPVNNLDKSQDDNIEIIDKVVEDIVKKIDKSIRQDAYAIKEKRRIIDPEIVEDEESPSIVENENIYEEEIPNYYDNNYENNDSDPDWYNNSYEDDAVEEY